MGPAERTFRIRLFVGLLPKVRQKSVSDLNCVSQPGFPKCLINGFRDCLQLRTLGTIEPSTLREFGLYNENSLREMCTSQRSTYKSIKCF